MLYLDRYLGTFASALLAIVEVSANLKLVPFDGLSGMVRILNGRVAFALPAPLCVEGAGVLAFGGGAACLR